MLHIKKHSIVKDMSRVI